ncbi:MAG: TaqI-like C-terminal specificity domain-containing protein [Planctomycetota bacterium]
MKTPSSTEVRVCPQVVLDLVARFREHREDYQRQAYNEAQVRREFIDPFFKALGWDVFNEGGLAEAYKDVIHEDAIKVGGSTKAPDYCFRIGGVRKFFVEAKKPAVGVKDDPGPAYQLRRYAWTNKLPLSIITDFEEFAVYDCRLRPRPTDKTTTARVLYLTFEEYAERWGKIASIFSKEAVLKGSFDKYAESNRRKRGTAEVDAEFLREIEGWREALARNIALRNPHLSVRELNYAVGKIIDRIIFLRMCEDRGVETYAQLRVLLNGTAVYQRLVEMFYRADERYNSGLFHFAVEKDRPEPPDQLTPQLEIDDKVLKDIIGTLYYPECPYEFSVFPTEILGQVYEQFLGKVIRLTKGHRAQVEDKPEVRKAGGVYYTPAYIVDYIVKHTVGKLLEGKTPADVGPDPEKPRRRSPNRAREEAASSVPRDREEAARMSARKPLPDGRGSEGRPLPHGRGSDTGGRPLRILDPACGSGSFLLGAYQYLLDWHRDWYVNDGPEKHRDRIYQGAGGQWRLTIAEKKRILLNNIYGVDIDPQAVEVTKLSLLLRVLEGETQESLENQLRLFHERALPDLGANIKCGNSLIGPDFYDGQQMSLFDEEERYRINAFDWHAEFPEVFVPNRDRKGAASSSNRARQGAAQKQNRARKEAARPPQADEGAVGFQPVPTPDATLPLPDGRGSDSVAADSGFDAVIGNPPYLFITEVPTTQRAYFQERYRGVDYRFDLYGAFVERAATKWLRTGGTFGFIIPHTLLSNDSFRALRELLSCGARLYEVIDLGPGVFQNAKNETMLLFFQGGKPSSGTRVAVVRTTAKLFPQPIERFEAVQSEWARPAGDPWLVRGSAGISRAIARMNEAGQTLGDLCTINQGLRTGNNEEYLAPQPRGPAWEPAAGGKHVGRYEPIQPSIYVLYEPSLLDAPRRREIFSSAEKLVVQEVRNIALVRRIVATYDSRQVFCLQSTNVINRKSDCRHSLLFLLGLLNSTAVNTFFRLSFPGNNHIPSNQLARIPIPDPSRQVHDRLVALVQQMLDLHKSLAAAKTPDAKTALQRQIDATDRQIDHFVYELYGLTNDEINIVEEATSE